MTALALFGTCALPGCMQPVATDRDVCEGCQSTGLVRRADSAAPITSPTPIEVRPHRWECVDCTTEIDRDSIVWQCGHTDCDDEFCTLREPYGWCERCAARTLIALELRGDVR